MAEQRVTVAVDGRHDRSVSVRGRGAHTGRRRRRAAGTGSVLAAVALLASACGSSSGSTTAASPSSSAKTFHACMVADIAGINDHSFNASAWKGMQNAAAADPSISVKYLESPSASAYAPNIQAFVNQKCGIIVTVGFEMATATQNAAKANPKQKFAIVDYTYSPALPNVIGLHYNTNQDAFLGGYLAAAMSKSGVVGTFGGIDIPPVTIYMNGFVAGVRYYDQKNHAKVKVLGWNPATNKGLFTGNFTSESSGKLMAATLMQQGADVIFPVAGSVGLGTAAAVEAAGPPNYMEWVDTDGCISAPQYCNLFLTSVTKGIAVSVKGADLAAAKGTFTGGNYNGTLANGGVSLAPFHQFANKIPASVQQELATLKAQIIAGKVSVNPLRYPAAG